MSKVPRGVLLINAMNIGKSRVNTCTIDEAFDSNMPRAQYQLQCNPKDAEFLKLRDKSPAVRQAGEKLYNALVADQAGQAFFAQQAPASAVFFHVDTPDAEELPWEILWEMQKNFMALDPQGRWPIARLASASQRAKPLERAIGSELRVAVVLAAAGESGVSEWESISAAMAEFAAPLHVLALVSEEEAITRITSDAAAWARQEMVRSVEVDFVGDSTTLISRLRAHVPNIVHFFCHGITDVRPQLELEARSDRRAKRPKDTTQRQARGSITLGSEMLVELALVGSLWLVVLNCCQGAKTAPHLHSLARDLVAKGVPAVVAMRESVHPNDAHLFAQHFYADLFPRLKAMFDARDNPAVPKPLPFSELVWVRAVDEARRQLSLATNRKAESSAEWTYPVVYVHRDELKLHPRELKAATVTPAKRRELVTKLDLLRSVRATLDVAPDDDALVQRTKLDAEIQQIVAQLEDR